MGNSLDGTVDRPEMPEGYGIAPPGDGMIGWEWVETQLTSSRNYWIATTRPDGRPHAMPVWGVWLEGALYFGTDRASRKARNIAANNDMVAHVESGDDVVILEGLAREIDDTMPLAAMTRAYAEKYAPMPAPDVNQANNVWYVLRPSRVLAWRESDFPNTATRWSFGA